MILAPTITETIVPTLDVEATERRDALLLQAKDISEVSDRIDFDTATETAKEISSFLKKIEEQRETAKKPFYEIGKAIDALAKEISTSLNAEEKRLAELLGAFVAEERRKAEDAKRKADAEAVLIAAKAREEAAKAARTASTQAEAERAVDDVRAEAAKEIKALQKTVVAAAPKKVEGGRLTKTIEITVTDIQLLLKESPGLVILTPNEKAIKAIISESPNIQIPGISHRTIEKFNL